MRVKQLDGGWTTLWRGCNAPAEYDCIAKLDAGVTAEWVSSCGPAP